MRMPYLSQGALAALIILLAACPARAQHHAAASHAQAAHHDYPAAIHQMTPQLQKQMEQQYHQAIMQEQAQMAAMAKQAQQVHQQRLQSFNEWAKSNTTSSGSAQAGSLSHLPQSPGAFAAWYNTQKRNKARNKSYDPAYDQYREFEKSLQTGRAASQPLQLDGDRTQNSEFAINDADECTVRAGRSTVAGPVVCDAIQFNELAATDGYSDDRGFVDQGSATADGGSDIPTRVDGAAIEFVEFPRSAATGADSDVPDSVDQSEATGADSDDADPIDQSAATGAGSDHAHSDDQSSAIPADSVDPVSAAQSPATAADSADARFFIQASATDADSDNPGFVAQAAATDAESVDPDCASQAAATGAESADPGFVAQAAATDADSDDSVTAAQAAAIAVDSDHAGSVDQAVATAAESKAVSRSGGRWQDVARGQTSTFLWTWSVL